MDLEALFKISYGIYIVATKYNDIINGYISNDVFQVTAEPPSLASSCSKQNYTCDLIKGSGVFTVSVLSQNTPQKIIQVFGYKSGRDIKKFEEINYRFGITGAPIVLDNTIAYYECKVTQTVDVGTHLIFIADIIDSQILDSKGIPMTYNYYREVRKAKAPKNAPTFIDPKKLISNPHT